MFEAVRSGRSALVVRETEKRRVCVYIYITAPCSQVSNRVTQIYRDTLPTQVRAHSVRSGVWMIDR